MNQTASQVRSAFIEYFEKREHALVPSSPVVPHDDPTLLFANAGMNQFKPAFLGQVEPGSYLEDLKRAVNSQKCIRAGGKHNDLDDVGKDTYHHTFFEMLGNWSIGDYFKEDAIFWAFEFLTKVCGLDANRFYATYFQGDAKQGLEPDHESRDLWHRHLPENHVLPGSYNDNFWEMGDTGPCGPCSELHYDRVGNRDAAALVNKDDPDVLEVWNLVFIQFNRKTKTQLEPLPAKHVDTGMGLERLVSILQDKPSNYDTDLFMPIFGAIESVTGARAYQGLIGEADTEKIDMAYRVVADHIRTLSFAIADGAVPSNEGRGYVLRRILRRAVRYGRQMLGAETGFLSALVPTVVGLMDQAFGELAKNSDRIVSIILDEEESFGRTLDKGMAIFDQAAQQASQGTISGPDAFQLYDTFGFPLDLTVLMAEERGMTVDVAGFERSMDEQKQRSRAASKSSEDGQSIELDAHAVDKLNRLGIKPTADSFKHEQKNIGATVKAIFDGKSFEQTATVGGAHATVGLVLDRTCFYAEAGGQLADRGTIIVTRESHASANDKHDGGEFRVTDVQAFGGHIVHIGHVSRGEIRVDDNVELHVERTRRTPIQSNHTATHILNFALRRVIGADINQKGSLVAPDRLRFDFSHNKPLDPEQIAKVEEVVKHQIAQNLTVYTNLAPLYVAQSISTVRAVFGERYPDPVRVVSVGQPVEEMLDNPESQAWLELSVEFCGGTHVQSTQEINAFALVSETGIAKGVRRIEALTGIPAQAAILFAKNLKDHIASLDTLDDAQELSSQVSSIATELDQMTMPLTEKHTLRTMLSKARDKAKAAQKAAGKQIAAQAVEQARQIADSASSTLETIVVSTIDAGADRAALMAALSTLQSSCPKAAVMLMSPDASAGRVAIVASVPEAMTRQGLHAGNWLREVAQICGGKGGGKPTDAQGGGTDLSKIKEAIAHARSLGLKQLGM